MLEHCKKNIPPIVIPMEERIKYFEFLRNKDIEGLANWLRTLSEIERKQIESFNNNSASYLPLKKYQIF